MFPVVLLEQLPPQKIAQVCKTFRDWVYQKHNGPPVDLSWIGEIKDKPPSWSKIKWIVQEMEEALNNDNREFLLKIWRLHPEILKLCWYFRWDYRFYRGAPEDIWPRKPNALTELVTQGRLELFTWILENMDFPELDFDGYRAVNIQTAEPYPFFRQLILHNLRLGIGIERSGCTSCRIRPFYHRGWTIRALVQNDDAELMRLYLDQQIPGKGRYSDLPPQGYRLDEYAIFLTYRLMRPKAAEVWRERGLNNLTLRGKQQLIREGDGEVIQFAIDYGIDLSGILLLRYALKISVIKGEILLKNYWSKQNYNEWAKLTKQNRKHLVHSIQKAGLTDWLNENL